MPQFETSQLKAGKRMIKIMLANHFVTSAVVVNAIFFFIFLLTVFL